MASVVPTEQSLAPFTDRAVDVVEQATQVAVIGPESYEDACELRKTLKGIDAEIVAYYEPRKADAARVHKQYCTDEKTMREPVLTAIQRIDRSLLAYDAAERKRADDERRRLEAEARAKEEARRREQAEALKEHGQERAAEAVLARPLPATMPVAAPVAVTRQKGSGVAFRTTWKAAVVDLELLVKHVAAHPEHLELLQVNQSKADDMASALHEGLATAVPGLDAVSSTGVAGRR